MVASKLWTDLSRLSKVPVDLFVLERCDCFFLDHQLTETLVPLTGHQGKISGAQLLPGVWATSLIVKLKA